MTTDLNVHDAQTLVKTHYENFPVAPFFLPKKIREPIALIYAFARTADDYADEGDLTPEMRLKHLQSMHAQLPDGTQPPTGLFKHLNPMIEAHQLPCRLFHDLIDAFMQDVTKTRYENFEEVLDYCRRSANPVGRLLLHLTKQDSEQNLKDSDAICSALQLINFLQDIRSDLEQRDRIYVPLNDFKQKNASLETFCAFQNTPDIQALIDLQWERAHNLMNQGAPLGKRLKGLFGFEIRLTIQGGQTILSALQKRKDPFARPALHWYHWIKMVGGALF